MRDNKMLTPMATRHVPDLPSPNPEPIDIYVDDDMNTKSTNTTSDTTMDTSKTTTSPAPTSAEPTSVKTEMNTQTTESVTENTNQVLGPTSESQSALVEVNVDTSEDKNVTEASANPKPVEETTSASPTPPEAPGYSHATPTPAQDATSEDFSDKDNEGDTVASATVTPPSTEMSAESELEGPKPAAAEVKDVEATKNEPGIEILAAQEPALSNTEATEPMDLDVVDNSGGEFKNVSSNDHDPNPPAEEVTHAQGGSDHKQVAFKTISPADVPMSSPDSTPRASQSDDTTTKVSRLHATYDTSGESRASEREDEKMEDDTVPGAQAEHVSSDNGKIMAAEPVVNSNSPATTFESTAEQGEEETILPAKTQGSLFGGPDGKQISPIAEVPQTSRVDHIAQSDTPGGLENLIENMTGISTESNSLLEQSGSFDAGDFDFGTNSTEEDAGPDVEKDIESEAVLGAQREVVSPPPDSDHDAKPDISACPSNTSPAYTHTTSSTSSQLSHTTSATQAEELNELINLADLHPPETDAREFSPEFFNLDQTSNDTDQPVLESTEEAQPCYCRPRRPCQPCVARAYNLRDRPECVHFGNQIPDTDTSGNYTDDVQWYPSTREVDLEDLDEDEETNGDEERDCFMSGGLASVNTDLMGRFSNTIPFNKTDSHIRDKKPFEEESSSEDEFESKKSKKRKKKGESSRQAKRPKITDMTDITDDSDTQPPHLLSRTSRSIKKTASRITEITDDPDTQPTHRGRDRSHVLPHLSTTLGILSESLQRRQSESGATKPTKKTTSKKKKKKTSTNTPSTQPTQTIIQMVQRVAKPLTTKLSYPINFNAKSCCSICSCPSYAIIGTGSPRNVKIYDFGHGNREMPDANQAGKSQHMQPRPEETSLCLACTTAYMRVLMCNTHDVVPLDVESVFEPSAAFAKASGKQCTKDEVKGWCSLCPAPASYFCDKDCGAKFCDTCGSKVYAEDGDLNAMLDQTKDETTHEYKHGLRADVELLRKGGELERFLARMAAGAGRNRTG